MFSAMLSSLAHQSIRCYDRYIQVTRLTPLRTSTRWLALTGSNPVVIRVIGRRDSGPPTPCRSMGPMLLTE